MSLKAALKFMKDVKIEVKRVTWPDMRDTVAVSAVVGISVLVASCFFLVSDYLIHRVVQIFIQWGG
ncbi:Protein translocase subunit SecE [Alphaproteobacteria bacterium]